MGHSLTIALAQFAGRSTARENLDIARDFALEASQHRADLLVLPEMFMALPKKDAPPTDVAEPLDGSFLATLKAFAQKFELHILATLWEKMAEEGQRVSNTAVFISPQGALLGSYRKLHLFDALRVKESDTMLAGEALPPLISVNGITLGMAICYDLRFPELFRALARQGAEVIIVPSAWYAGTLKEDHWLTLLRARAIENTCYVAGCNQTGSAFCGRSAIFDPFGVPVADAGEGPKLLLAELQADRIAEVRSKLPALQHIRSDLFGKAE